MYYWLSNDCYPGGSNYDGSKLYKMQGTWDFWPKTHVVNGTASKKLCQNRIQPRGSSGSSAWDWKKGTKTVYAIASHTKKTISGNPRPPTCYTRITQNKFGEIQNVISSRRPGPLDLTVLNVEARPTDPSEGTDLTSFSFLVYNRSTAPGFGPWKVDLYLSDDSTITAKKDTHLGSYRFSHQFSGQDAVRVQLPGSALPELPLGTTGKRHVGVILDVSDGQADNDASDAWDAQRLTLRSSPKITFETRNADGEAWLDISPRDIDGDIGGPTPYVRRYGQSTTLDLDTTPYVGTNLFSHWEEDGSPVSTSADFRYTVRKAATLSAVYEIPDIPVRPHELRVSMPEYHTTFDKTESVSIHNKHGTAFSWTATIKNGSGWVSVDRTSGTLSSGAIAPLDLSFSTDHLASGTYTDYLEISSSGRETARVELHLFVGNVHDTGPDEDQLIPCEALQGNGLLGHALSAGGGAVTGGGVGGASWFGQGAPGIDGGLGGSCLSEIVGGKIGEGRLIKPGEGPEGQNFGNDIRFIEQEGRQYVLVGASGGVGKAPPEGFAGKAYLYERSEENWSRRVTVQPEAAEGGDRFGHALASAPVPGTDGTEHYLAMSAPATGRSNQVGRVFVYRLILGDLVLEETITPAEPVGKDGFGVDLAMTAAGGAVRLAVGAPASRNDGEAGYVSFLRRGDGTWILEDRVTDPESDSGGRFGTALSLRWSESRSVLVVGAPGADREAEDGGLVHTFRWIDTPGIWTSEATITADLEEAGARLGSALDLRHRNGRTLLIAGAPGSDSQPFGGGAYVFHLPDAASEWQHRGTFRPDDVTGGSAPSGADFGASVTVVPTDEDTRYGTGAPEAAQSETVSGASYDFTLPDPTSLPAVELSPDSLTAEAKEGERTEAELRIANTGRAGLTWSIDSPAPWITLSDTSGAVSSSQVQRVTARFNTADRDTGSYASNLVFRSNDANRDSLAVPVAVAIRDRPEGDLRAEGLTVSGSDSLRPGGLLGADVRVRVRNAGSDPVGPARFGLFLSRDSLISPDDSLVAAVRYSYRLSPSDSAYLTFPRTALVPESFPSGDAHLIARADYPDAVTELVESNNVARVAVEIGAPHVSSYQEVGGFDSLTVELGASEEAVRILRFTNTGRDSLAYSWFQFGPDRPLSLTRSIADRDSVPPYVNDLSPRAGSLGRGDTTAVRIRLDGAGTDPGTYRDTLSMITNDPDHPAVLAELKVSIRTSTGTGRDRELPTEYRLHGNRPNPFNPATRIRYELPEVTRVQIRVYDVLGRHVATLARGRRSPGTHSVRFDASRLPSGMYFYRMEAGGFERTREMMLVR